MPAETFIVSPSFVLGVLCFVVWVIIFEQTSNETKSKAFVPVTFVHELSHWLIAHLFGCNPTHFAVLPSQVKGQTKEGMAGQVLFTPSFISGGFVAMAPLMVSLQLGILVVLFSNAFPAIFHVLLGIVGSMLIVGGIPSRQDFRILRTYPLGGVLTLFLLAFEAFLMVSAFV